MELNHRLQHVGLTSYRWTTGSSTQARPSLWGCQLQIPESNRGADLMRVGWAPAAPAQTGVKGSGAFFGLHVFSQSSFDQPKNEPDPEQPMLHSH